MSKIGSDQLGDDAAVGTHVYNHLLLALSRSFLLAGALLAA